MIGKVILAGGGKCPICGKVFTPEVPLRPNNDDRDFYGGRVKFFKKVTCDCLAEYDLCIEKRYNALKGEEELNVINMIVLKEGTPLEELRKQEMEKVQLEAEAKALEAVHEAVVEKGDVPTLKQRNEIKRQTILATIIDADTKIETLMLHTLKELTTMCKLRKLKVTKHDTKKDLAEKLLAYDPTLVVANPND